MSVTILGKEYNIAKTNYLYLENINIFDIPDEVFSLVNLDMLSISDVGLKTINPKIAKLVKLEYLYLDNNIIKEIPKEIINLTKLKSLNLDHNEIIEIPIDLHKLENTRIDLRFNKIKKIHREFLNNKSLFIDETSYDINNLDMDCEILIFSNLCSNLTNLPISLKEIYFHTNLINKIQYGLIEIPFLFKKPLYYSMKNNLKEKMKEYEIKMPFGCEIKYY